MIEERRKDNDHDLLVRLDEKVGILTKTVQDLVDGTTKRIADLENGKADRGEVKELQDKINKDLELRVRALEGSKSIYFNSMLLYTAGVVVMIGLFLYHIFQS